jgi:hypothetical protein
VVTTLDDYPIVPPIRVKDSPHPRKLETIQDAQAFVDEALAVQRSPPWRGLKARFDRVQSEEDAIEAIGALREILALEGLLDLPRHGAVAAGKAG